MTRPQTRVTFCQTLGELRSRIGKAQREHLRPPPPLRTLDPPRSLGMPTKLQQQDACAAYWCEQAIRALNFAEQAWDDPQPPGG